MKRVLLVDLNNCMYYLYHAKVPQKSWSFLSALRDLAKQFDIDRVVITGEGVGGSSYRLALYPEYKWERKKRRKEAPPEEQERIREFLTEEVEFFVDLARLVGLPVLRVKGAEADDVISYLVNKLNLEEYRLLILSTDSDLNQLLRPGVVQAGDASMHGAISGGDHIPGKAWLNSATFTDQHGITPEQYVLVKSLSGDTSDSIPSPGGLGDTIALRLIQSYGDLETLESKLEECTFLKQVYADGGYKLITAALEEGTDSALVEKYGPLKKFKKDLKAGTDVLPIERMKVNAKEALVNGGMDMVRRNLKLVNLSHDDATFREVLGEEGVQFMDSAIEMLGVPHRPNREALSELMLEHGKVGTVANLDFWLSPFTKP